MDHRKSISNNNIICDVQTTMESFPYPECWADDQLMQVLMGPFRLRSLNPENYDSQMRFWKNMIAAYCKYKACACFHLKELKHAFRRKNCIPYDLGKVIEDMRIQKEIRIRSEYEYDPMNSWTGWAINSFIKKPLSWGLRKIPIIGGGEPDEAVVEYIHLLTMKNICNDLQSKVLQKHEGQLLKYDILKEHITKTMPLSEDSINLCLHTLNYQKRIGMEYIVHKNEKRIQLVKIPGKFDPDVEINETNRAVHKLEVMQACLLKQLEEYEDQIKLHEAKVSELLKKDKRKLAKTCLRKKHLLEANFEKHMNSLHNVESLLLSIKEAKSSGEILGAYKIGSAALKNVLNESGLKYDNVDDVISDVRETIESHKEVEEIMSNTNISDGILDSNISDDLLEKELKELLGEDEVAQMTPPKSDQILTAITAEKKKQVHTNSVVKTVEISDDELLAMLEGLDVVESSPSQTTEQSTHNDKVIQDQS